MQRGRTTSWEGGGGGPGVGKAQGRRGECDVREGDVTG